jgi:hypothetical protein
MLVARSSQLHATLAAALTAHQSRIMDEGHAVAWAPKAEDAGERHEASTPSVKSICPVCVLGICHPVATFCCDTRCCKECIDMFIESGSGRCPFCNHVFERLYARNKRPRPAEADSFGRPIPVGPSVLAVAVPSDHGPASFNNPRPANVVDPAQISVAVAVIRPPELLVSVGGE